MAQRDALQTMIVRPQRIPAEAFPSFEVEDPVRSRERGEGWMIKHVTNRLPSSFLEERRGAWPHREAPAFGLALPCILHYQPPVKTRRGYPCCSPLSALSHYQASTP